MTRLESEPSLAPELLDYRLRVNGVGRTVEGARIEESLLYVLRERLGLFAAKNACEEGECGSCSVLVDGRVECACMILAATAVDRDIVTLEGLAPGGVPTVVQQAFLDAGAVQCGYCTPGLVMSVTELLAENPEPSDDEIREAISGNLCRCTGYDRIVAAVRAAAEGMP